MLYNSFEFIFVFLPLALVGYFVAGRFHGNTLQLSWIIAASCIFYAFWDPIYIFLLVGSLLANFILGQQLMKHRHKLVLVAGIALNVSLLAYFKYRGFIVTNFAALADLQVEIPKLVLPLGISFFTFQKIAYLVDVYKGRVIERSLLRYAAFITFFPQLIAGPIVHYVPLMRQFDPKRPHVPRGTDLGIGIMFFVIGLAKKVGIADNLAPYADRLFATANASVPLGFFEAWLAVLTYGFQIYFDFSGYSDMAIGLARMFGIRLPLNFDSPYKARSIIDFWRRWHITLSRFLRDYVYIPLGGSHHGLTLQLCALLVTMLLGGLWHGANWTFVIWGGVHGLLLAINHLWRATALSDISESLLGAPAYNALCLAATFLSVMAAWVLFRSQSLAAADFILSGLIGANGFGAALPDYVLLHGVPAHKLIQSLFETQSWTIVPITATAICAGLLFVVWVLPNSQEIMSYRVLLPVRSRWRFARWRPNAAWFAIAVGLFYWSLSCMVMLDIRPFTYFAF